jgi:hypothetical protein
MAELKVLPGTPPAYVMRFLREGLALSKETLEAVNHWLKAHDADIQQLDHEEMVLRAHRDLGFPRHVVSPAIEAVLHVGMFAEDDHKFEALLSDLRAIKLTDDQVSNFTTLMDGLRFSSGPLLRKIWAAGTRAIPNVTDTRVVCDLRAVFAEEPRGQGKQEVSKLLALVPMVIMSLDIQDESGDIKSVTVQFSEAAFARLGRILTEASRQLEQITQIGQQTSSGLSKR